MRKTIPPLPQSALPPAAHDTVAIGLRCPLPPRSLALLAAAAALLLAAALARPQTPASQAPVNKAPAAAAHQPTRVRKHSPAHLAPSPTPVPILQDAPPMPETPKWPAFDKAAAASVVWDSHGLVINAANSSLEQIMRDVSTATGAKVEGLSADQRVFGQYGPGQARDVLSELLLGSGYNVIMIGDQGQGTPRQILLSIRQAGGAQPAARPASSNDEDDSEEPPANQEPGPGRLGFPPAGGPRNPQQFQQEMRERQQQQQQPGPPGQQPQPPN